MGSSSKVTPTSQVCRQRLVLYVIGLYAFLGIAFVFMQQFVDIL